MYLISLEGLGLYEVGFKDEYFKAFFFFRMQVLFAFYFVYPGMWLVSDEKQKSLLPLSWMQMALKFRQYPHQIACLSLWNSVEPVL